MLSRKISGWLRERRKGRKKAGSDGGVVKTCQFKQKLVCNGVRVSFSSCSDSYQLFYYITNLD